MRNHRLPESQGHLCSSLLTSLTIRSQETLNKKVFFIQEPKVLIIIAVSPNL